MKPILSAHFMDLKSFSNFFGFYSLLFIGLMLSACGGTSNLPGKVKGEMEEGSALKRLLLQPEFPSSMLAYSGRVSLDSRDFNVSGTVKVYLENEKVCWIRLSKFGFEVGRFRITPDSIIGINKLQRTFIRTDIQSTRELIGTDLSFKEIQHLVWGIPMRVNRKDQIRSQDSLVQVKSAKNSDIQYSYLLRPPLDMVSADWKQELENGAGEQHLTVKQFDFHKITDDRNFSYIREYSFRSPVDQLAIELNISKVALDESQSTDIDIPSSYTPY